MVKRLAKWLLMVVCLYLGIRLTVLFCMEHFLGIGMRRKAHVSGGVVRSTKQVERPKTQRGIQAACTSLLLLKGHPH